MSSNHYGVGWWGRRFVVLNQFGRTTEQNFVSVWFLVIILNAFYAYLQNIYSRINCFYHMYIITGSYDRRDDYIMKTLYLVKLSVELPGAVLRCTLKH